MKSRARDREHLRPAKSASLEPVLRQSENIRDAVAQAVGELVSVNETLKQDNQGNSSAQRIDDAIAQNVDVELKVAKAADDLDQVNTQLAGQVARQASLASELADTKSRLAQVRDDLSESQTQEKEARQKALRDRLTGIPNRASFDQALDHDPAKNTLIGSDFFDSVIIDLIVSIAFGVTVTIRMPLDCLT